MGVLQHASAGT